MTEAAKTRAHRDWKRSPKGKASYRRYYKKMKADPVRWAKALKQSSDWHKANKKAIRETRQRWFKTENGRRYKERRQRNLLASTPEDFLQSLKLLESLKKEMRK